MTRDTWTFCFFASSTRQISTEKINSISSPSRQAGFCERIPPCRGSRVNTMGEHGAEEKFRMENSLPILYTTQLPCSTYRTVQPCKVTYHERIGRRAENKKNKNNSKRRHPGHGTKCLSLGPQEWRPSTGIKQVNNAHKPLACNLSVSDTRAEQQGGRACLWNAVSAAAKLSALSQFDEMQDKLEFAKLGPRQHVRPLSQGSRSNNTPEKGSRGPCFGLVEI